MVRARVTRINDYTVFSSGIIRCILVCRAKLLETEVITRVSGKGRKKLNFFSSTSTISVCSLERFPWWRSLLSVLAKRIIGLKYRKTLRFDRRELCFFYPFRYFFNGVIFRRLFRRNESSYFFYVSLSSLSWTRAKSWSSFFDRPAQNKLRKKEKSGGGGKKKKSKVGREDGGAACTVCGGGIVNTGLVKLA